MTSKTYQQPIGLFLLALLLLFVKSPDAILAPQFWAEDGAVFFADQFQRAWPPLLTPYAGYLHTVTRLVAWIAGWFDFSHAPLLYNVFAIVIDAVCIAFVSMRMRTWVPQWAVFASFLVVPASGDIFGTVTNVQWFMQFALAAACFTPAAAAPAMSRAVRAIGHVALALAALSGPFSVLVTGLAAGAVLIGRLAAAPDSRPHTFSLANIGRAIGAAGRQLPARNVLIVLVCAAIQATVLVTNELRTPVESFMLSHDLQASFGVLDKSNSFFMYTMVHPFFPGQLAFLTVMIAVSSACLVHALFRPSAWHGIACLFLGLGIVQPILAYMKQREAYTLAATSHYFYLLGVVCCWIAWRMVGERLTSHRRVALAAVAVATVLAMALRPEYFHREALYDMQWARHVERLRKDKALSVIVPINPAPWHFKVDPK
jgi:hypothetical protein